MRSTEFHPTTPDQVALSHEALHQKNAETAFFEAMDGTDSVIDKELVITYLESLRAGVDAEKKALEEQKDELSSAIEKIRSFQLDPPDGKEAKRQKKELINDAEVILEGPEEHHSGCNLNYF